MASTGAPDSRLVPQKSCKMWVQWYVIKHGHIQEPLCDLVLKVFRIFTRTTGIYVGGPLCTPQGHGRAQEAASKLGVLLRNLMDVARREKEVFMDIKIDQAKIKAV